MQGKLSAQGTGGAFSTMKKRSMTGAVGVVLRDVPAENICRYRPRPCSQPAVDNYHYCLHHILEDKNAPYKTCGYVYSTSNKRCLTPTLKSMGHCLLHGWKTNMKRQRNILKRVPPVTAESLLHSISHPTKKKLKSNLVGSSDSQAVNPFEEWDLAKEQTNKMNILDCMSESDSDAEATTLEGVWKGSNEDSSDAESVDSQMEEPLRHARVFTAEEVAIITRSKLQRLQLLYQRQFERLSYILKERRRQYLHDLNKEKQAYCAIVDQPTSTSRDVKLYEKLKALKRYAKASSEEAVLQYLSEEKRVKQLNPKGKHFISQKCAFSEGGVKCSKKTIPQSKYCFKHILEDNAQVLFKACGCEKAGDSICQDTVTALGADQTCIIHVKLPPSHHQITTHASDTFCSRVTEETTNMKYNKPPAAGINPSESTGKDHGFTSNSHNSLVDDSCFALPPPPPPIKTSSRIDSHVPLSLPSPSDITLYPIVPTSDFPEEKSPSGSNADARERGDSEGRWLGGKDGRGLGDEWAGQYNVSEGEKGNKDGERSDIGCAATSGIGRGNEEDTRFVVEGSSVTPSVI